MLKCCYSAMDTHKQATALHASRQQIIKRPIAWVLLPTHTRLPVYNTSASQEHTRCACNCSCEVRCSMGIDAAKPCLHTGVNFQKHRRTVTLAAYALAGAPHVKSTSSVMGLFHPPRKWLHSMLRPRSAGHAVASSFGRVPDKLLKSIVSFARALRLLHAAVGRVPVGGA